MGKITEDWTGAISFVADPFSETKDLENGFGGSKDDANLQLLCEGLVFVSHTMIY